MCVKCNKKGHLRVHTLSKHVGIIIDCDQCVYKATQKSSLSNKKSKHEGIKSSEYKATIKSHLRVHTLSKRERIRFDCDNVSTKKSINSAQTMGTWFDCDQSEYKDSLRLHKQSNMNGSNITVTSVSTKQQLKVIWECTHHRSMRWSNLIVNNVSTKQHKRQSKNAHSIETWRGLDFTVINATQKGILRVHKQSKHENIVQANSQDS